MPPRRIPTYAELVESGDPRGSAWRVFGPDDEAGSLNFMTPDRVVAATRLVTRGVTFSLDYAINDFPSSSLRKNARHVIFARHRDSRDDYLDRFYLQGTSQIDGLRHRRHAVHGFYNGFRSDEIRVGWPRLGIQHWANTGIVGRGVLADVDRHLRRTGVELDHERGESFSVQLIDETVAAQGVELRGGDVLLIRTGWAAHYLTRAARGGVPSALASPGIVQSRETIAWLWNHQFTLIGSDNAAVEAVPVANRAPFDTDTDHGLMHQEMIALLGLALGERLRLDELASDCSRDGVYEFLFVSKPLTLVGGVGSTANALAIK